jgi:cytochrome c biogenesis factor
MILLYIISVLVVFFGFAIYNYYQTDKNKTIPAGAAWFAATFWPIMIPLALIFWVANKGEKLFNNISKNGLKDDIKRKSN